LEKERKVTLKMNNIKKENFLTELEFKHVKSIIDTEMHNRKIISSTMNGQNLIYDQDSYSIISPDFGRINLRKIKIGKDIEEKFIQHAKEITGLNDLELSEVVMFTEYNKKYGIPALMPHCDSGEPNILLDYQVYSNIDWSLVVDNIEFFGKDNSVLNIYNTSQLHYRPAKYFKEGDFIGLLFFNFFSPSFKGPDRNLLEDLRVREEWSACQNKVNQKG
jgi:hypothetical protein